MIEKLKEDWKIVLLLIVGVLVAMFFLSGCEAVPHTSSVVNPDGTTTVSFEVPDNPVAQAFGIKAPKGSVTVPSKEVVKEVVQNVQETTWKEVGIAVLLALGANQLKPLRKGVLSN